MLTYSLIFNSSLNYIRQLFTMYICQHITLLLFVMVCTHTSVHAQKSSFTAMSFNIRYDNPDDGKHAWPNRKQFVTDIITRYGAEIIGVQEAEHHQLRYLDDQLKAYTWFGVGRDDGKKKGEFTAIFYHNERFELLAHDTFWCSETPEQPKAGWDAALPRTVTWGLFRDKQTTEEFRIYNNHFDHRGELARKKCAQLLLNNIADHHQSGPKVPVLVTGDFNATPDSPPYRILTGKIDTGLPITLLDAKETVETKPRGPNGTFTGFDRSQESDQPIDYIFVNNGFTVHTHTTTDDTYDDILPSDHYPTAVELSVKDSASSTEPVTH